MNSDLLPSSLTDAQRRAILHAHGPLLIVAGPGAGKTDVIVRRTAHLVLQGGVDPKSILVTTFTRKAAEELYDRLWPFMGKNVHEIQISTIHAFCQGLIHEHPDAHPWGTRFEVLDDKEQYLFVFARLRDLGLHRFPKARMGDFLSDVVRTFNLCTEELVDPEALHREVSQNASRLLGLKKATAEAIEEYVGVVEAYGKYLDLLSAEYRFDFPMLQKAAYEMVLEHDSVRTSIAKRFRYFLVDEYQDTNRLQVLLLKEIARPANNVCAVGDDDQSIYRFRGATVSSFISFEKDFPGAAKIELNVNFRSAAPIVEGTSALISHNAGARREKHLVAVREKPKNPPFVVQATTCADEAQLVIQALVRARKAGFISSYNDAVILLRSVKGHAEEYLKAMDELRVPYSVSADGAFFDREDILHLRDLFTFCSWKQKWNPEVLSGKILELDASTIEAIVRWKEDPSGWLDEGALKRMGVHGPEDRRALQELARTRVRFHGGEIGTLLDLFYEILRVTGYFETCCSSQASQASSHVAECALLNLAQFSNLIDSFQRIVRTQNAYRFGEYLRSLPERSLDSLRPEPPGEAVRVMTVHQAKGLEFPVVIIGSAMEGRFPSRFRRSTYPVPSSLCLSRESEDEERHLQDERRLFYVAATRARDLLVIGAPEKVAKRGGGPSRFAREMGAKPTAGPLASDAHAVDHRLVRGPRAPTRQRVSYSALQVYLLCPLQYKLLNDYGYAVPQAHWARFGQIMHAALESVHKMALAGETVDVVTAHEILQACWNPLPNWSEERERSLRETGMKYLTQYCESHKDRFHRITWVEEPVDLPVGDQIVVTGRIDLACRVGPAIEIIDFKVRSRKGLNVFRPDLQAGTYSLACHVGRGVKIDRTIIHLLAEPPGSDLEVFSWTPDRAATIQATLDQAATGILAGRFGPTPGAHCAYCDFRRHCPSAEVRQTNGSGALGIDEPSFGAIS